MDVQAELDLGVLLQRWLAKLTDTEATDNSTGRRSLKTRPSTGFGKKGDESSEFT